MFEKLKHIKLVLVVYNLDKKLRIEADTPDYMIGGVLSIKCEDEK